MADRPRTFEEVVVATDPEELARLDRGAKYDDAAVASPDYREVYIYEAGSEWRAREYFGALKSRVLRTIRETAAGPHSNVRDTGSG
jgi:hypothetical protein